MRHVPARAGRTLLPCLHNAHSRPASACLVDVPATRAQFPALRGHYLDSACTSLKPVQVIDAVAGWYQDNGGCPGRSTHSMGAAATESVAAARERVAAFARCDSESLVVTRNCTEAINVVARGMDLTGATVLTTDKEHNSNLVPWLASGARHEVLSLDDDGLLPDDWEEIVKAAGPALVAVHHVSNVDGAALPAKELTELGHDLGARVLIDGAQAMPHMDVDVTEIGADYYAWSGHKMMGPGIGFLAATPDSLGALKPVNLGGHTVNDVGLPDDQEGFFDLAPGTAGFEPGVLDPAPLVGVAAACDVLDELGRGDIAAHELRLNLRLDQALGEMSHVHVHGPPVARRGGITAFTVDGLTSQEVALYLDEFDVMVRAGQHCTHAWHRRRGLEGTVRASCYAYNDVDDVDALIEALHGLAP